MSFSIRISLDNGFNALGAMEELGPREALKIFNRAGLRSAEVLRVTLRRLYKDGVRGHAPNHPITLAFKSGSQPLRDTGELANALELIVVKRGNRVDYAVGLKDERLATIANANEDGAIITVTEGLRNFFAANGLPLKASTNLLFIPPRPLFGKAVALTQPIAEAILTEEFLKALDARKLGARGTTTLFAALRKRFAKLFR